MIPYGRQWVDEEDIASVVEVLRSPWLTTGPKVEEFERAVATLVGAEHAVAVSSGTAALHAAMYAIRVGPGDEVILPPMTFAATANAVLFQGGVPVFVDVEPDSLLIDPQKVEDAISSKTKAVVAVDYAGQPCNYHELRSICEEHGLVLVADACHSLGGSYRGNPVGSLADLNVFSFHPVKPITTGEGGMVTTNNPEFAERMRRFRNHCISTDYRQREKEGSWFYQVTDLGYNYRLTDIQAALGISQLKKLPAWIERRQEIARIYTEAFANIGEIEPLREQSDIFHAYHLYVVRCERRDELFSKLRSKGIGVNVHYIPVHLHPLYRERFGTGEGLCPLAEEAYREILSLPVFPAMRQDEVSKVIETLLGILQQ